MKLKLHTPPPPIKIVRLTFRKTGYGYEYIMLQHEDIPVVIKEISTIIENELIHSPFEKGAKIGIDIRAYEGSKAGTSKSISFNHKITPKELKELILKNI